MVVIQYWCLATFCSSLNGRLINYSVATANDLHVTISVREVHCSPDHYFHLVCWMPLWSCRRARAWPPEAEGLVADVGRLLRFSTADYHLYWRILVFFTQLHFWRQASFRSQRTRFRNMRREYKRISVARQKEGVTAAFIRVENAKIKLGTRQRAYPMTTSYSNSSCERAWISRKLTSAH